MSSPSPPVRLPAARRRQQLLEVALRVFAERGFHAASMNEIAEHAGVTKPVLYQHFSSKRELYMELLQHVGDELRRTISEAAAAAGSGKEQVVAGFRVYFEFVANRQDAFQFLFGAGTRRDQEFADAAREVEASIAAIIARLIDVPGLDDARRLLLAHGVVGLAEGASRHWILDGARGDPRTLADQIASLAWAGLRAAPLARS